MTIVHDTLNPGSLREQLKAKLADLRKQRANPVLFEVAKRHLDRRISILEAEIRDLHTDAPTPHHVTAIPTPAPNNE
jgi:hypothetical protein